MRQINLCNIETDREILADNEGYKVLFFKFEPTKGLPNHSHDGYATIQVLDGEVDMKFENGNEFELKSGDLLPFNARIEHNVTAKVPSKILVTITK